MDLSPVRIIASETTKVIKNAIFILLSNISDPIIINKKANKKLPTINSSLKKLTIRSFFMELSKPKILNPKINSKNTSIQTINRIIVQEKIIFLNMSKCNNKYLNEKINKINFINKKFLLIEFVKSIPKNEFKIK